ncbi:hypothetical protein Sango_2323500 [Sesamum angolense]|uniref:Retrotransposon gag domain-containing protein n=1 Tax=Sesamum angolense TaxID=2727404 RepID=A0AAE1WAL9_9LAMI|nr:hypothetical protein Sango_2323500 [Sesamum angolense]
MQSRCRKDEVDGGWLGPMSFTGEDPHKHLKEFQVVCSGMKPSGLTDEQLHLRAFPFSLKDKAKDWLYYLPSGSIQTWADMKQ